MVQIASCVVIFADASRVDHNSLYSFKTKEPGKNILMKSTKKPYGVLGDIMSQKVDQQASET